jgi:hypothetical protein
LSNCALILKQGSCYKIAMPSITRFTPWLLAITLPLCVQLLWLLTNTQLPISDATGSYLASYNLAQLAYEGRWQEFIAGLYTMRDWRPTALCLVLLPFALASHGNLMFMAAGMCFTCLLISATYVYHLLRLALPPTQAALGTALLGLMPTLQHPATYFGYTEVPFMAAMLAAFYHLLRVDFFQNRRHCVFLAIAVTLAFALRPIETLFHFVPILAFVLWQGWRSGKINFPEIYATVTLAAFFASVLMIAGWWPHGLFVLPESAIFSIPQQGQLFAVAASITLISTALLIVFFALRAAKWRQALRQRSHLPACVGSISAAVCMFYYSFMTPLVQWIYITNLGELGTVVAPKPVSEKLVHFVLGTGLMPLASLFLLSISSIVIPAQAGIHLNKLVAPKALRWIPANLVSKVCAGMTGESGEYSLLPLLMAIPVSLILTLFTCQFSQRKVTLLFVCLLVVLVALALQPKQRWNSRLVALLVLLQTAGVGWISAGHAHTALLAITIGSPAGFSEMVTTRPNPHDTVVEFLLSRAKKHGYRTISLPILGGEVQRLVDPFLLHILTEMKAKDVEVFFPHINSENAALITSPPFWRGCVSGGSGQRVKPHTRASSGFSQ